MQFLFTCGGVAVWGRGEGNDNADDDDDQMLPLLPATTGTAAIEMEVLICALHNGVYQVLFLVLTVVNVFYHFFN